MKSSKLFLGCLALGSALAADNPRPIEPAKAPSLSLQARTMVMHVDSVGEIYCHVNDSTMISLPDGEEAMVVTGGDAAPKGTWIFQAAANGPARRYLGVKPSLAGSTTTLHVVTNHNTEYSFVVREVSNMDHAADVTVRVIAGDDLEAKVIAPPVLVSAEEANRYKQEAADALVKLEAQKKAAEESIQSQVTLYRTQYTRQLDHNYRFDRLKAPFNLTDVWTDGTFTYVSVDPRRTKAAAIYTEEGKKHSANLPNFTYDTEKGIYTITGVVQRGYLAVKDDRVDFARLEGGK